MANRLLPFRQYNEHFVVNMFALEESGNLDLTNVTANTHAASGNHDAGVLVKVSTGGSDLGAGYSGTSALNAYLGKTDYPHVGFNENPEAAGKFDVASGGDVILGVTLNQTLAYDENGEKMLYYRQKALELQGVLPGEAVPILTKGIITVAASGINAAAAPTAGGLVYAGADGKFTNNAGNTLVGSCLAVGDRDGQHDSGATDYWAGNGTTGAYYIIKIDL